MDYSVICVLLYCLVATGVVFFLFDIYRTKHFTYWKERGVPYVEPHWLFGSFKDSILQTRPWPQYCRDLYNKFRGHRLVGTYTFIRPSVYILDPQLIDHVLVQDFTCFEDRGVPHNPHEPLLHSLTFLKGQEWRDLRQKLSPTFTSRKIKDMFEQIYQSGEHMLNEIDQHYESDDFDMEQLSMVFATEVIASCTFGIQLKTESEVWRTFSESVKLTLDSTPWLTAKTLLSMIFPRLFQRLGIYVYDKAVNEFFTDLTKSTIKYREENNVKRSDFLQSILLLKREEEEDHMKSVNPKSVSSEDYNSAISQGRSMFDVKTGNEKNKTVTRTFTENCIASFMFSFVTIGVSLEVGTISFAMYELARNPSIQKKLQEEIDFCTSKYKALTYDAVKGMSYLDQVLQETLRIYNLSPVLIRDVTAASKLPGTDVTLDKGMFVIIPIEAIHMDPRYYPSPESFDPDRFVDNNFKPHLTYLPFGQGPRMCVAVKFAVLIMKVCIARILSKYDVAFGTRMNLPLRLDEKKLFIKSVDGIWLRFKPRKQIDLNLKLK